MRRRDFIGATTFTLAEIAISAGSRAAVPKPYDVAAMPPLDNRDAFMAWMTQNRGENPTYLAERWSRYRALVANKDVVSERDRRAFLMTPREEFVLKQNLSRAYDHAFLDIGYGVTISGPHIVGRMTTVIDVNMGDKVLEIGTGSGYQSAYLANLTDKVWSIEIIKPLAERTRGIYDGLIGQRLHRVQGDHLQERRRLLRLGGGRPLRQDHRHLRHRPRAAAAAAAAQGRRHHGHSGRPSGRAARPQGEEGGGAGQEHQGLAVRHLRRQDRALRALHQAGRRDHQGDAQQVTRGANAAGEVSMSARPGPAGGPEMRLGWALYLSVGLLAGAVIALQICIMRIFSVGKLGPFRLARGQPGHVGFRAHERGDVRCQELVRAPVAPRRRRRRWPPSGP